MKSVSFLKRFTAIAAGAALGGSVIGIALAAEREVWYGWHQSMPHEAEYMFQACTAAIFDAKAAVDGQLSAQCSGMLGSYVYNTAPDGTHEYDDEGTYYPFDSDPTTDPYNFTGGTNSPTCTCTRANEYSNWSCVTYMYGTAICSSGSGGA